jgi:hypothetical protein
LPRAFEMATRPHRDNAIVVYEESPVSNDSELGKRATAPGYSAPKRQKLRAAGNQPVRHGRAIRF